MNVIFLSPHFPPQFWLFCRALRDRGVTVLAIGDAPAHELRPELRDTLSAWCQVPDLGRYDEVLRAVASLIHRYGRIDRIDSLNEHWLELEARLRLDFNIPGQRPEDTAKNRSKSAMREVFRTAGVPSSEGERLTSPDQARALADRLGYPLVFKPDVGVGAARTFRVNDEGELRAALAQPLEGFVVEKFVSGRLTSFDGLVDRAGRVVFCTSHIYSAGIMDVVNGRLPIHYWSRREIPSQLEDFGRRALAAFGVRERFFHLEFFQEGPDRFRALEINVRPPGGFTTDLLNYACDIDVYALWARVLTGGADDFTYERRYHAAHAARRRDVRYRLPHDELVRRLGPALCVSREIPAVLSDALGDWMYLLRHEDEAALLELIGLVEAAA
jgi:biotin carboxylase